jgi:hypothetical protein
MSRAGALGLVLVGVLLAACNSPEATRMRGGGPGGDTGNRSRVVEMHGGSEPYWKTPRVLGERARPTRDTARRDEPAGVPAASPR